MPQRALPARRLPAGPSSAPAGLFALVTLVLVGTGAWTPAAATTSPAPSPATVSASSEARDALCAATKGAVLRGKKITQDRARSAELRCADLRGADLSGLDLVQRDLRGARLAGADLRGTVLEQAELTAADLTGVRAAQAHFVQAHLDQAVLDEADLAGADLGQADASGASLRGADLTGADLVQVTLTGADLTGATLRDVKAGQAHLEGARLDGADLAGGDLTQAGATGASLAGADLTGADLTMTDLTGARLDGAVLAGARLSGTTRPGGFGDADPSGDAPLDAIAAIATLLLALGLVVPALRSSSRRRRTGDDARGTGPAALAACVLVLAGAAALVVYELGSDVDWSDALMILPMITVLLFVGVIAAGLAIQARRGVLGALATLLGLAGYFVLVATIMSAVLGSAFGEYPRAPSCTAATCAWGYARGWTGVWIGAALLALCWLVGRLTRRTRPDRLAKAPAGAPRVAEPVAARPAEEAAPSGDANAAAYQAVRDFRKG